MAAVVTILALLLGPVTSWTGGSAVHHLNGKEKADAINGVRQTLLQAAAGTAALTVLVFTGLTFTLNRKGQVTDRYTKAIGLLASGKLDERIGGIYALEHIMLESERDHETVVQVLAAFVREHAAIGTTRPALWIDPPPKTDSDQAFRQLGPPADIQTALTVLGRRPTRKEVQRLDLRRSNLRRAVLRGARLEEADLDEVHLEGADLTGPHLEGATLLRAHLKGAALRGAHLQHADLDQAHLEGADLTGADLGNATLYAAHLERAELVHAHLQDARLVEAHLEHARLREAHLEHADLIRAHLEHASLYGAYLRHANLGGAYLTSVNMNGAHLERAFMDETHLEEADLTQTVGLTFGQIENVYVDAQTKLPAHLQVDPDNGPSAFS
jgi:uncharacterized protein YjbI with pentapeptide repeats